MYITPSSYVMNRKFIDKRYVQETGNNFDWTKWDRNVHPVSRNTINEN